MFMSYDPFEFLYLYLLGSKPSPISDSSYQRREKGGDIGIVRRWNARPWPLQVATAAASQGNLCEIN